jgi:hypothetical protein
LAASLVCCSSPVLPWHWSSKDISHRESCLSADFRSSNLTHEFRGARHVRTRVLEASIARVSVTTTPYLLGVAEMSSKPCVSASLWLCQFVWPADHAEHMHQYMSGRTQTSPDRESIQAMLEKSECTATLNHEALAGWTNVQPLSGFLRSSLDDLTRRLAPAVHWWRPPPKTTRSAWS